MCSYCCVTCLWNVFFASRSLACYLKITHWGAIMHWHIWFSDIHLHLCRRFSGKKRSEAWIMSALWDLSTKGLTAARIASRHQHKAGLWAEGQWCKSPDGLKTAGKVPSCTSKIREVAGDIHKVNSKCLWARHVTSIGSWGAPQLLEAGVCAEQLPARLCGAAWRWSSARPTKMCVRLCVLCC